MQSFNIKQELNKKTVSGLLIDIQEATPTRLWRLVFIAVLIFSAVITTGGVARADDFSYTNFVIKDPVIKPGAGFATSDTYQLWSSIGQEAIGISTAGSFTLKSGFLYFPAPSETTTPPEPPPPIIVPPGGGSPSPPPAPSTTTPPLTPPPGGLICDFNSDGKCNIIDLSIMLYYVDKPYAIAEPYDLNRNGKVDFPDISILLYYWT